MHHPVGLLRLPVLAEVCVEYQDLLASPLPAAHRHRPRLAGLVPPRLAPLLLLLRRTTGAAGGDSGSVGSGGWLNLPALAGAGGVGLGRPVEEVPAQAVLGDTCISMAMDVVSTCMRGLVMSVLVAPL